jgi:uncharacterized cupin superfamily protein
MAGIKGTARSLNQPDEHTEKGGVSIAAVQLGEFKVKRQTYPAGWRFSKNMGQDRCYDTHVGYVITGQIHVELEDGTEYEIRAGDAFVVPSGHDAWVVGDEECSMVQFDEGESAARRFGVESRSARVA